MAFKSAISEKELQELLRPKLRLFLSVDVVGSTAFKNQSRRAGPAEQSWLSFFATFYTEFREYLFDAREQLLDSAAYEAERFLRPTLWKALGDELIFVVELTHRSQVGLHIKAFRLAVNRAINSFCHGVDPLPISFKATGWLAGFPIGNAAIPLEGVTPSEGGSEGFDFVGPQIDIGFRIAKFSSPRRFVVSVELAWLLLLEGSNDIKLYYEGKEPLKGVLNERGYPIIWIDAHESLPVEFAKGEHRLSSIEDQLAGREPARESTLRDFCGSFVAEIGEPLFLPFIHGDLGNGMEIPEGYGARVQSVEQRIRDVLTVSPDSTAKDGLDEPIQDLEDWIPDEGSN